MSYIPNTDSDRQAMLDAIGVDTIADLFAPISAEIQQRADFSDVPVGLDDIALRRHLNTLSSKNADMDRFPTFLGAGIYDHYIPPTVGHVTGRSEFYTAYTPYQPEVSQGILQSIYEFQTLICQLTGMDVSNASMYDGATALAEAAIMACDLQKRTRVLMAGSVHPAFRETVRTYMPMIADSVEEVAPDPGSGRLDPAAITDALDDNTACILVQQPNFFGVVEDLSALAEAAHPRGALLVVAIDPIALGLLAPPGECGADIVVGEGQSLGCAPAFGGPLLGLFACRKEYVRRLPGRIVGGTIDSEGTRAYTMTLRTREQDIRRDQATSNICTNQALFALAATVYLSTLGKSGLKQVANLCLQKAHYAQREIVSLPGFEPVFAGPFFKECAVRCPEDPEAINRRLLDAGIIGGLPLARHYPDLENTMLFCVTEARTKEDIDSLVRALRGG